MLHSGDYYLFESDSEDEDELQSEEQKPQKQTACQVLTHTIYSHKQKRKVSCCMMYAVAKMRSSLPVGVSGMGDECENSSERTTESTGSTEES